MKFEVRYPDGAPHEVEIEGTVAVLGRDPSCDLVLNDVKCSRRHAVLEVSPQGTSIRDAGSANGTYVNDKKVDRATLQAGDIIRLGDIQITVLAEEMPGTVVMGPEDIADLGGEVELEPVLTGSMPAPSTPPPRPAPPAPPPPPAPRRVPTPQTTARTTPSAQPIRPPAPPPARATAPSARPANVERPPRPEAVRRDPIPRPLTVTVIGLLWALAVFVYAASGLGYMAMGGLQGGYAILILAATLVLTIVSGVMAFGILTLAGWARVLQIALAVPGLLICPFTIGIASILAYMFRPETRICFSGRRDFRELSEEETALVQKGAPEGIFTTAVLGGFFLGVVLSAVLAIVIAKLYRPVP